MSEQQQDQPTRRLTFTPASTIKLRPVRWLWDTTGLGEPPTSGGRIPLEAMTLAAGAAGIGKSQWAAWLAAHVTRGTLPGALYGSARSVIYCASEDSWSQTIAPRLYAAGADLARVGRVDVVDDGDLHARLTLPSDISIFGALAEENEVGLVVLDPLLSLIDGSLSDYRASDIRQALEPLATAAEKYHFTVIGLAHYTKSGPADPLNRIAGSGAFGQVVRAAIGFAAIPPAEPDEDDDEAAEQQNDDGPGFVLSQTKNNLGRLDVPSFSYSIEPVEVPTGEGPSYVSRFKLGGQTRESVAAIMRAQQTPLARVTRDREANLSEVGRSVLEYVRDLGQPVTPAEVAVKLGITNQKAGNRLADLEKSGRLVKLDRGLYALPESQIPGKPETADQGPSAPRSGFRSPESAADSREVPFRSPETINRSDQAFPAFRESGIPQRQGSDRNEVPDLKCRRCGERLHPMWAETALHPECADEEESVLHDSVEGAGQPCPCGSPTASNTPYGWLCGKCWAMGTVRAPKEQVPTASLPAAPWSG